MTFISSFGAWSNETPPMPFYRSTRSQNSCQIKFSSRNGWESFSERLDWPNPRFYLFLCNVEVSLVMRSANTWNKLEGWSQKPSACIVERIWDPGADRFWLILRILLHCRLRHRTNRSCAGGVRVLVQFDLWTTAHSWEVLDLFLRRSVSTTWLLRNFLLRKWFVKLTLLQNGTWQQERSQPGGEEEEDDGDILRDEGRLPAQGPRENSPKVQRHHPHEREGRGHQLGGRWPGGQWEDWHKYLLLGFPEVCWLLKFACEAWHVSWWEILFNDPFHTYEVVYSVAKPARQGGASWRRWRRKETRYLNMRD